MRRKMKLIRAILEYVEQDPNVGNVAPPEIDGYSEAQIHYHILLCKQAGYLDAGEIKLARAGLQCDFIHWLTWAGHEELDRLRTVAH